LFLATGCSTTITNLTPRQAPRNAKNLYPFEVSLDTTQQSVKDDTVKAYVLVGSDSFPMQRTPLLSNRWETLVPAPAGSNFIYYRYKFDYLYRGIPSPKPGSLLSPPYKLELLDTPQ
jgi:hypothetical protein